MTDDVHNASADGLIIEPVRDAPADLVEFGRQYWAFHDLETGSSEEEFPWHYSLPDLYLLHGMPYRLFDASAAAGVHAIVPGATCEGCGAELVLRCREDMEDYVDDGIMDVCRGCDDGFSLEVSREATPRAAQRRSAARQRSARNRAVAVAEADWERELQDHVAEAHGSDAPAELDPDSLTTVPMVAVLGALTLLRGGHETSPVIQSAEGGPLPFAPMPEIGAAALDETLRAGVLRVHPSSPVAVCRQQQSFREALEAVSDDPARLGSPVCAGTDLSWAYWHLPGATADKPVIRRRTFDRALTQRLAGLRLASQRRTPGDTDHVAILQWTSVIIAGETFRAFNDRIKQFDLPDLPPRHAGTAYRAVLNLAEQLDLHSCLAHADFAVRQAAERVRPSTRGWHSASIYALQILVDGCRHPWSQQKRRWTLDLAVERKRLSALTWQLFQACCGIPPLDASVSRVRSILPGLAPDALPPSEIATSITTALSNPTAAAIEAVDSLVQTATLVALTEGRSVTDQLTLRRWESEHVLTHAHREWLSQVGSLNQIVPIMFGVAIADEIGVQKRLANMVARWLIHQPSEEAINMLIDFEADFGPFASYPALTEALIRMCVTSLLSPTGWLPFHQDSDPV